jgi:imidazole glycerol-phosphate synthase subunit HisH
MIVIVDYDMGNVGAVVNMLRKCNADVLLSASPKDIERADKLILPGVGAFDHGMQALRERNLIPLIEFKVLECKTMILGICLGLQLFTHKSEEGKERGLGWIEAETVKFNFAEPVGPLKIPHMGWNTLSLTRSWDLEECGLDTSARYYFVHSYHVVCRHSQDILATTTYGYDFASVVRRDNILGVQFHPEKSHRYGLAFLRYFKEL